MRSRQRRKSRTDRKSDPFVEPDPIGVGEQNPAEAILCWSWKHPKLPFLVSCRLFAVLSRKKRRRTKRRKTRKMRKRCVMGVFVQWIRIILYRAVTCATRSDFAPLDLPSWVCGLVFMD